MLFKCEECNSPHLIKDKRDIYCKACGAVAATYLPLQVSGVKIKVEEILFSNPLPTTV
jgi:transcription initiation factor TFIIIB Brf1 subunit/transcription initiation factor TFIIB